MTRMAIYSGERPVKDLIVDSRLTDFHKVQHTIMHCIAYGVPATHIINTKTGVRTDVAKFPSKAAE